MKILGFDIDNQKGWCYNNKNWLVEENMEDNKFLEMLKNQEVLKLAKLTDKEAKKLSRLKRMKEIAWNMDDEKIINIFDDKTVVFVNRKGRHEGHEFASFYYFEKRNYKKLNELLNKISQKIDRLNSNEKKEKIYNVAKILRGVIYDIDKNEGSQVFKLNNIYKSLVREHVKRIFQFYQTHPFDSRECAKMWFDAYENISNNEKFKNFENFEYFKNNFLTFNTAFQYIYEYAYSNRNKPFDTDEFTSFLFNTFSLCSGNEFPSYRDHSVMIRKGNWNAIDKDMVPKSIKILIDWYVNDKESKKLNPIEKACIMHCEIVRIQPFPNGNHRMARLIANEGLIAEDFPSVSIAFDKREEYNNATNKAIETHNIDDLIKIYYKQVYQNALKINECLGDLELKEQGKLKKNKGSKKKKMNKEPRLEQKEKQL